RYPSLLPTTARSPDAAGDDAIPKPVSYFQRTAPVVCIESVKEKILRANQDRVADHCRRRINAVAGRSTPQDFSGCEVETVNLAIAAAEIELLIGGVGGGIDAPSKVLCPAWTAGVGIHRIHPPIGAAEENYSIMHNRRSPDFSRGYNFPGFVAGVAINGIDFCVVATEQNILPAKGRRRMDLVRHAKFPLQPPALSINGVKASAQRSH